MRITGNELRLMRMFKNTDQQALAKMLGKSQQYISKLESLHNKELPAYWSAKIMAALGYNKTELEYIRQMLPPPRKTQFSLVCFFTFVGLAYGCCVSARDQE